jgi:hypothetical protein
MSSYTTKISKNGVVYYISVPKDIDADVGETVIVKLKKQGITLGVFIRRVAKLGNRKIITLPHRFNKIWRILHGETVEVTIEKTETTNIEEIVKKIVLSLRPNSNTS